MSGETKPRTPTETLIDALEDFGVSEPKRVLVIYADANDLVVSTNSPYSAYELLGFIEGARAMVTKRFLKGYDPI